MLEREVVDIQLALIDKGLTEVPTEGSSHYSLIYKLQAENNALVKQQVLASLEIASQLAKLNANYVQAKLLDGGVSDPSLGAMLNRENNVADSLAPILDDIASHPEEFSYFTGGHDDFEGNLDEDEDDLEEEDGPVTALEQADFDSYADGFAEGYQLAKDDYGIDNDEEVEVELADQKSVQGSVPYTPVSCLDDNCPMCNPETELAPGQISLGDPDKQPVTGFPEGYDTAIHEGDFETIADGVAYATKLQEVNPGLSFLIEGVLV